MTVHEMKKFVNRRNGYRMAECSCGWTYQAEMSPEGLLEGNIGVKRAQEIYKIRADANNERDRAAVNHLCDAGQS